MKGNDPSALQQISNHTPTCISAAPAALDRYLAALPAMSLNPFAPFAVRCFGTGRRNRFSRATQAVQMEFNGIVHLAFDAVSSCIGSNAAGKIGGIRRIAGAGFFDNNQDSGSFQSCLLQNTVLRTGRKIVTRFSGNGDYALFIWWCRYCRWLPRVRSRYHPSFSIGLMIARIFIAANRDNFVSSGQTRDLESAAKTLQESSRRLAAVANRPAACAPQSAE